MMPTSLQLGPILGYHGGAKRSVVVLLDDVEGDGPSIEVSSVLERFEAKRILLGKFPSRDSAASSSPSRCVWKFEFDLGPAPSGTIHYQVLLAGLALQGAWKDAPSQFQFEHARTSAEMRILFGSCMDTEDPKGKGKRRPEKGYGKFVEDLRERAGDPLHLLILGGDQVYTDGFLPARWWLRPAAVESAILGCYLDGWTNRPGLARMLAETPSVMMWDDHDILDGYGSHLDEAHEGRVENDPGKLREIVFPNAAKCFDMLQLRQSIPVTTEELFRNRSWVMRQDTLVLAALDARTERDINQHRIVTQASLDAWVREIEAEIDEVGEGDAHVLLVIPIPLLHLRYSGRFQNFLAEIGSDFGDDLMDNWSFSKNLPQELRLVKAIASLRQRVRRLVLLSGDSHMASAGMMVVKSASGELTVQQVTSSGLENTPGCVKSLGITGPGGEVPGNNLLKHFHPIGSMERWHDFGDLGDGLRAAYRLLPVKGESRGFDRKAKHHYFDRSFFYGARNAALIRLGDDPSVEWIFEHPGKQPKSPWPLEA
jgi:hypothetical protein